MKRRDAIKGLTALPITAGVLQSFASGREESGMQVMGDVKPAVLPGPLKPGPRIYQSIGVEPVINGRGTLTMIGGSVELPEVREAMEYAARYNVQLDELSVAVGARLAEITGAEWGMVSSGCAAGLKHVAVACLTDGNPEKLIRIPDLTGFEKSEVIIPRPMRNYYDHAIRNTGMKVIMPETLEELEAAINPKTALIYLFVERPPFSVANVSKIAKPKGVPILVDAAAERLTFPNVHLRDGADVVAYSGGKIIRGPQCAGLLLGRKDLLQAAWQSGSPHHGPGRDNKVGREEHIGMLAAVEAWAVRDHDAERKLHYSWADTIAKRVSQISGVTTDINQSPVSQLNNANTRVTISWNPKKLNISSAEIVDELGHSPPRIALGGGRRSAPGTAADPELTSISVNVSMMTPDQISVVGDRIFEVLSKKRAPRPEVAMKAPAADLTGRWNVTIQFFTGTSEHQFFIEKQDGNWVQGTHKGDFSSREMAGSIDGDQIRFNSVYSIPGNSLNYTFYGTVSGDTMTGDIHMGEYLMSKFKATRYAYPDTRTEVLIPKGPPFGN
jgi:D-glucosaminate-6-phosphate ammonia-lyase